MANTKAVIMARGLGSRMRKQADGVALTEQQQAAADSGVKAMISVGRPFLDHVISALADAGFTDICLVIGPEHQVIRDHYDSVEKTRVTISYAVQEEPLGTANAYLAAADFAGDDRVLLVNSDNYYPAEAVALLNGLTTSGLLGFDSRAMIEQSNIPADRVAAFALVTADDQGHLTSLIEKPSPDQVAAAGESPLVSMNCWLLGPAVLEAARHVPLSARGEYEIVDAVRAAIESGETVTLVPVRAGVLDMSNRGDIASVVEALADRPCTL
ncbi:nucleotidyltransferase family protein [Aestuariimicrobium kwangyangense]|uniref:nucleotidyltransferase family protein n=1 Tax=Aestuariimicrobium kwangyangense TaxID=396389 RepID=UPI0003B4BFFF|nr:nucleotidyltransferase family protein [Aestuariimicrobium kwangyangense]